MRETLGRPFSLLLFMLALVAGACPALAEDALTPEEEQLVKLAQGLDPIKEGLPRETVPGGYRSPLGMQLHPSCIKYAEATGKSRMHVEQRFRAMTFATLKAGPLKCVSKYPELQPYLNQVVSHLRRAVVTCTYRNKSDVHFGAMNIYSELGLPSELRPDERKGISLAGLTKSLPNAYKTVIMYTRDYFLSTIVESTAATDMAYSNGLLHELLHSTEANNRSDHNEVEFVSPKKGAACGDDIRVDRVNVIADLCTNTSLAGSSADHVEQDLFERISQCGAAQCEKLFMSTVPPPADMVEAVMKGYETSKGLPREKAQSVCAKIYDEGYCRHTLEAKHKKKNPLSGKIEEFTMADNVTAGAIPQLRDLGDRLRDRLYELFPHTPVQLNKDVLNVSPGAAELIRSQSHTPCFKAVFNDVVGGSLYLKNAAFDDSKPLTPKERFEQTVRIATKKLVSLPECTTGSATYEANYILEGLNKLNHDIDMAFTHNVYSDQIAPRIARKAETWAVINYPMDSRLENLIGASLLGEYIETLKKVHYKSPEFSCRAAGLGFSDAAKRFQSALRAPFEAQKCGKKRL